MFSVFCSPPWSFHGEVMDESERAFGFADPSRAQIHEHAHVFRARTVARQGITHVVSGKGPSLHRTSRGCQGHIGAKLAPLVTQRAWRQPLQNLLGACGIASLGPVVCLDKEGAPRVTG